MRKSKKTSNGCRPAQLFGCWAIEESRFRQMVNVAVSADLVKLSEARAAAPSAPLPSEKPDIGTQQEKPYEMYGSLAILPVSGPMTKYPTSFQSLFGGCSTMLTRDMLRAANEDPDVGGIMLHIDSPGGTVSGTGDLADEVAASGKPCYAFIEDLGCSAAYWVASQCKSIACNPSAMVGSIGVAMILQDTSGQYAQEGVKVHLVKTGEHKADGADGVPITDAALAEFQRQANDYAALFKAGVAKGRGFDKAKMEGLADGRAHVGQNAVELGLVDEVSTFDAALQAAHTEISTMEKADFLKYAAEHQAHLAEAAKPLTDAAATTATEAATKTERDRFAALSRAFADRPAFALEQGIAGHDLGVAKANLADVLLKENADLKKEAAAKADAQPGVPGASGGHRPKGTAKAEFDGLVQAKVKNGMRLASATVAVVKENPDLHKQMLDEANADRK